jgi:predicted RecA/RadA family phage recombinase
MLRLGSAGGRLSSDTFSYPIGGNVIALCNVKLAAISWIALAAAVQAQSPAAPSSAGPKVRHIIGLDDVNGNASGILTVRDGMLHFQAGKSARDVPVSTIDDVYVGAETTQSGGKTGRVVKTAAIAAPFESGKALTILMRTKVDILTVAYHDSDNGAHGAIFALPKGQGETMRSLLVQAGAHTSPAEKPAPEDGKK